jgi:hypothetical protein
VLELELESTTGAPMPSMPTTTTLAARGGGRAVFGAESVVLEPQ